MNEQEQAKEQTLLEMKAEFFENIGKAFNNEMIFFLLEVFMKQNVTKRKVFLKSFIEEVSNSISIQYDVIAKQISDGYNSNDDVPFNISELEVKKQIQEARAEYVDYLDEKLGIYKPDINIISPNGFKIN